jgi:UDP-N-acetylglucosamine acyltransferase
MRADSGAVADTHVSAYGAGIVNFSCGRNCRGRVNPGRGLMAGVQTSYNSSKSGARVLYADQSTPFGIGEILRDDQTACLRGSCLSGRLAPGGEADLGSSCCFERRRRMNFPIAITFESGIQRLGDVKNAHANSLLFESACIIQGVPIDASAVVAQTACVHGDAVVGPGCIIGEFCVIEQDVVLGAQCRLEPYVYVKRWTMLGDRNEISAGTVLGTDPLDKAFPNDRSYLRIGHGNKIREHYTISRGTKPESVTEIGNDNYIMTSGHIAHNAKIGNSTVIASCALVAGYVEIADHAFVSGGVVIHQFSRIGRLAMIGGNSRVNLDAPPFFLYSEFDIAPKGLNVVGLRRAGFTEDRISILKKAYRLLYRSGMKLDEALAQIDKECDSDEARELVRFVRTSERGICRP